MFSLAKKFLPVLLAVLTASCSNQKDLPTGERISIINNPSAVDLHVTNNTDFKLSDPVDLTSWLQIGSNAAHLNQNILTSENAEKLFITDFGKGASKRNLLMAVPVVANNMVYTQDVQGKVTAFDLKTGDEVFSQKLTPLNKNDASSGLNGAGLAVNNKQLYALTGFGGVFALNALTGEIIWRHDLNTPIRTSPTVADGMLFVQTINNQIFCLNTKDGSELWRYNISAEDTTLAGGATPAFDSQSGIVVTAFSNGELQAFNAKIGYPVWSQDLINTSLLPSAIHAVKASPVIDGHTVYAVGRDAQTMAIHIETGEVIWQIPVGGLSSPLVDKEVLFMVSNNYELLAVSKKSGQILWHSPLLSQMDAKDRRSIYVFSPLLLNNTLFVVAANGIVMRFDAKTGHLQSEDNTGEKIAVQPIASNRSLFLVTDGAKLIVFR